MERKKYPKVPVFAEQQKHKPLLIARAKQSAVLTDREPESPPAAPLQLEEEFVPAPTRSKAPPPTVVESLLEPWDDADFNGDEDEAAELESIFDADGNPLPVDDAQEDFEDVSGIQSGADGEEGASAHSNRQSEQ